MRSTLPILTAILALPTFAFAQTHFAPSAFDQGSVSSEGWHHFTGPYSGFPVPIHPGAAPWPTPLSSTEGSGDAVIDKLSGNAYPYVDGDVIYSNAGAAYGIFDLTPLVNVSTIGLQIDISDAGAPPFLSNGGYPALPELFLNGSATGLSATFSETINITDLGIVRGAPSYRYTYYFQWDVSSLPEVDIFEIRFSVNAHVVINALHLDQTDAAYNVAAIPEPSTYALLAVGALGAAYLRRRKAA